MDGRRQAAGLRRRAYHRHQHGHRLRGRQLRRCRCLAGLTLMMFPEEARRVWDEDAPSPPLEAARQVLGLDPLTAREVFEGCSSGKRLHELGRDQMLHALERAAAGAVGADVWK